MNFIIIEKGQNGDNGDIFRFPKENLTIVSYTELPHKYLN
jgi:hypothetical protein